MSKDYVICWINGRREFYDDYQQAFKENVPKKEEGSNEWLNNDNEMHFLFWHASHTIPPVRSTYSMWKDVKTYESRLRSTYSENSEGEYETTDQLMVMYGKRREVVVVSEGGCIEGFKYKVDVLSSSYSCNEEAK